MKRKVWVIALCLLVLLFAFSGWQVISTAVSRRQGRESYQELSQKYAASGVLESTSAAEASQPSASLYSQPQGEAGLEAVPIDIDFQGLQEMNPDIVGWLYSDDTGFNFPVAQGTDNTYYLRHLPDGTYHSYGTVFEDAGNTRGFSDGLTILYGHNMTDGAMFAQLPNYADQSYFEAHDAFWLLTPEADYRVAVFAGYTTTNGDPDTYQLLKSADETLTEYAKERIALSDFQSQRVPEKGEKLLMLSTCEYSGENSRYVLFGILQPLD